MQETNLGIGNAFHAQQIVELGRFAVGKHEAVACAQPAVDLQGKFVIGVEL